MTIDELSKPAPRPVVEELGEYVSGHMTIIDADTVRLDYEAALTLSSGLRDGTPNFTHLRRFLLDQHIFMGNPRQSDEVIEVNVRPPMLVAHAEALGGLCVERNIALDPEHSLEEYRKFTGISRPAENAEAN